MNKKDYIDNVIIRLQRQYGKDELVAAMIVKLKESEFKVGELTSERDELKYDLKTVRGQHKGLSQKLNQYENMLKQNANLKKKNITLKYRVKELEEENKDLINKRYD